MRGGDGGMERGFWFGLSRECREILASVTDLFYPRVCEVCGRSLAGGEQYICTHCLADFPFTDETFETGNALLEGFPENYRPWKLHTLYYYNKYSEYKNLIYLIKYQSYRQLALYLGTMLGEKMVGACLADCIIPVPLHPKREKLRGFNQAAEIAKGINRVLQLELMGNVVLRTRNNVSQTGKNAAERLKNVEDIFSLVAPEKIQDRHVLLVDDVITTGATIGSCLQILARAEGVSFSLGCLAQTV